MHRHTRTVILAVVAAALCASAQTKPFGIGVIVGEPMGATMKVWFNPLFGMDLSAGADFGRTNTYIFRYEAPPAFQTHLDFIGHIPLVRSRGPRIAAHIGGGVKLSFRAGFEHVRARTPLGLTFLLPRKPVPWELFIEFAPTWGRPLLFDPDAALGFRYYF